MDECRFLSESQRTCLCHHDNARYCKKQYHGHENDWRMLHTLQRSGYGRNVECNRPLEELAASD